MERLVYIITLGVRPRRLQAWYRRHPKTTLAGDAVVLTWYVVHTARQIKAIRNDKF